MVEDKSTPFNDMAGVETIPVNAGLLTGAFKFTLFCSVAIFEVLDAIFDSDVAILVVMVLAKLGSLFRA
jgi:hypothetical protein